MSNYFSVNLIEEIAYNRCVIFIGAGVSSTAVSEGQNEVLGWYDFIDKGINEIPDRFKEEKDYAKGCLKREDYLQALQVVNDYLDSGAYTSFLKSQYQRLKVKPSEAHELLKRLNNKIIVSTNFDKIYDNYCIDEGHTIIEYYEIEKLLSNIKSYQNIVLKAHGTIDNVDRIVFTQNQYYKSKRENHQFYKVLESLFITKTVLFLGYSLNDPDINLLLDTAVNTASDSAPHYVMVTDDTNGEKEKHWKKNFNISTIRYGDSYEQFIPRLTELVEEVENLRVDRGIV